MQARLGNGNKTNCMNYVVVVIEFFILYASFAMMVIGFAGYLK